MPTEPSDLWRKLYNRCDPDEPLDPEETGDTRYVDVDTATGEDDHPARDAAFVDELERSITLSDRPTLRLFTGLPGSGKSTELRRLATRLRQHGYLPVLISAETFVDLLGPLPLVDVLAMVAFEAGRVVVAAEQGSTQLKDDDGDSVLARLLAFFGGEVELGAQSVSVQVGTVQIEQAFDFRKTPTVRQEIRAKLDQHLGAFHRRVDELLTELDGRARNRGWPRGLVVIVDSLEKLSLRNDAVLDSAERLFGNDARDLQLPVHALYTVPPALALRVANVVLLPMIKLHPRGQKHVRFKPGIEACREIIRRRIPDAQANELLGAPAREDAFERVIAASGGYPRDLIRLLRQMVLVRRDRPLTKQQVTRVIAQAHGPYEAVARASGALRLLREIHRTQSIGSFEFELDDDAHRKLAHVFSINLVLAYKNDEAWFDVHPALWPLFESAP